LQKKILILGAGIFQLPGIRKAVDLGYHVITLDYLPDNIGHKFSHKSFNCSTTDKGGVLQIAEKLSVDGICTFSSDVASPTVGYVCDKLGLPGISYKIANIMTNKHLFRSFMRDSNLFFSKFVFGKDLKKLESKIRELVFPILFKPDDSSGSRGITKLNTFNSHAAHGAFKKAQKFSHSGIVCVEEFIDGIEIGGDGFLIDGHFTFVAITQKYLDGFVVTGHRLPGSISEIDKRRVILALEECCHTMGYLNGPLNFDVFVEKNHITIIEISARNGGNGIPSIIEHTFGVDVEAATLKYALGEKLDFSENKELLHGSASFVFGSQKSGVLKNITDLTHLSEKIPKVYDLQLAKIPGDFVETFDHNGNLIGYVLFDCKNNEEYLKIINRVKQELNLVIN